MCNVTNSDMPRTDPTVRPTLLRSPSSSQVTHHRAAFITRGLVSTMFLSKAITPASELLWAASSQIPIQARKPEAHTRRATAISRPRHQICRTTSPSPFNGWTEGEHPYLAFPLRRCLIQWTERARTTVSVQWAHWAITPCLLTTSRF